VADAVAEVTMMIQDESRAASGEPLVEKKRLKLDDDDYDRFLGGPASRRIAVVDFDPDTGAPLGPPAAFVVTDRDNPAHGRIDASVEQRESAAFLAMNAYATVFETVRMFEEPGALGRQVIWAFKGEQLLVVPRAGEWANACYDRDSRSLQFYFFQAGQEWVYTALSRDIVAHECGHALLDAVVPSLHDASTPESLAIHEAVADLVAVLMALRSSILRTQVLAKTGNSISDATEFSSIAERFGMSQPRPDQPHPQALRMLLNDNTMNSVDRTDPHELSTVLSGLFYASLVDMFENGKTDRMTERPGEPAASADAAANASLGSAAIIFRRLLLRGIDYLPPGELTFADVGRATIAADIAADPRSEHKAAIRELFAQRFVKRGVVDSVDELAATAPAALSITPDQLADIRDSDWAAYTFVDKHRPEFGIPADQSFKVLPRVDATKQIGTKRADGKYDIQRELLLKIAWDIVEDNGAAGLPAPKRRVQTGATLAIRWSDGSVLALIRSNVTTSAAQRAARDEFLTQLLASDAPVAIVDTDTSSPPRAPSGIQIRIFGDVAKITGTQRLLHIDDISDTDDHAQDDGGA
jgi:hypothetical protein